MSIGFVTDFVTFHVFCFVVLCFVVIYVFRVFSFCSGVFVHEFATIVAFVSIVK